MGGGGGGGAVIRVICCMNFSILGIMRRAHLPYSTAGGVLGLLLHSLLFLISFQYHHQEVMLCAIITVVCYTYLACSSS